MIFRCWRDHSLSIVLALIGLAFFAVAIPLGEGTWFDIIVGLGHGALSVALLNLLAGRFRERNRPED